MPRFQRQARAHFAETPSGLGLPDLPPSARLGRDERPKKPCGYKTHTGGERLMCNSTRNFELNAFDTKIYGLMFGEPDDVLHILCLV